MKQHKASPKQGSQRPARKGAPKASVRKTASAKASTRAKKTAGKAAKPATRKVRSAKAVVVAIAPAPPVGYVKLPSECLIGTLDGLRAKLLECVTSATPVSLDAASVERIDTAALQLLAAFTRDRTAAGLAIEWVSVSASLTDAATLLNLTSVLAFEAATEVAVQVAA